MTIMESPAQESPPAPPSRLSRFRGAALRWAAAAGAVFALGIIATWVVQVGPRTREITRLRGELETTSRDLATAQAELERLGPVEEARIRSEQRRLALEVLVDVTRAQAALARGEKSAARIALRGTGDELDALAESLGADSADRVQSMHDRLDLILSEIDSDVFAAQSDLSILSASLAALDQDLAAGDAP